jgi:hypothetical protein
VTPVQKIPDYLNPLVSILSTYIEHKVDHFTLQTYGGQYVDGPYVQALQEHDNVLLIESVSNEYLNPQLDEAGQQTMLFLGWRFFPERYLPNYAQFIDQSKKSPREIAEIMVRTLHFAYGIDETYTFELGPKLDAARALISEWEALNA